MICSRYGQTEIICTEQSLFGVAIHRFSLLYSFNDLRKRNKINTNTLKIHQAKPEFHWWTSFLTLDQSRLEIAQLLILNPRVRFFGIPKTLEIGIITTSGVAVLTNKSSFTDQSKSVSLHQRGKCSRDDLYEERMCGNY